MPFDPLIELGAGPESARRLVAPGLPRQLSRGSADRLRDRGDVDLRLLGLRQLANLGYLPAG